MRPCQYRSPLSWLSAEFAVVRFCSACHSLTFLLPSAGVAEKPSQSAPVIYDIIDSLQKYRRIMRRQLGRNWGVDVN
jgi:hypothetical protein